MSWFDNIVAAIIAAQSPPAATAPSAAPTSAAPPAPAAAAPAAPGMFDAVDDRRRGIGGTPVFEGPTTTGLRGAADNQFGVDLGGENAQWGVNPATGLEEPVFNGYLLSDLMRNIGDWNTIHDYGSDPSHINYSDNYDPYIAAGPFAQSMDLFGARPGADFLGNPEEIQQFIRTVGPMVAALFTGGATAGESGAAAGGDAATAGGGEVGSGYAASAPGQGMFANIPGWALNAGSNLGINLVGGASPTQAVRSAITSGAVGASADAATPYINEMIGSFDTPAATDDFRRLQLADSGMLMSDVSPSFSMPPAVLDTGGATMLPAATPAVDPTFGGALTQTAPGMFSSAAAAAPTLMPAAQPEQGDPTAPPPEAPVGTPVQHTISSEQLQRYVKVGQQVAALLGSDANGPQAPAADASPEEQNQYLNDVVQYLGLDAQTMADAGLTPGSPEYTDYILQQADSIIAQVMGGMDVDSADLAQQLRSKTDSELQQLQRALYVRGQLGQQMGQGTYADPFTGNPEEVIGSGMFDPNTAAFQRGLAGSVDKLGGLRGSEAYDQLQSMLGRNSDLFGMQQAADQRFEQAKLDDEEQRRRAGMLSF